MAAGQSVNISYTSNWSSEKTVFSWEHHSEKKSQLHPTAFLLNINMFKI